MRKFIPNLITLLNVLCGVIAINLAYSGNTYWAACFILFGAGFDFFDGFAARALNAYSELGKQLDSLADIVTFGVAPALIFYKLIQYSLFKINLTANDYAPAFEFFLQYACFVIPLFAAYRLAKFNIDDRQTESFLGLPTPANGIFLASLAFVFEKYGLFISPHWLVSSSLLMAFMMVSDVPMLSLKFKNFHFKENAARFILLATAFVLLIGFQLVALPIIIGVYILLSVLRVYF